MVVRCEECGRVYRDEEQWTICPHRPLEYPALVPAGNLDPLRPPPPALIEPREYTVAERNPWISRAHQMLGWVFALTTCLLIERFTVRGCDFITLAFGSCVAIASMLVYITLAERWERRRGGSR